jgi:hypothetical protein
MDRDEELFANMANFLAQLDASEKTAAFRLKIDFRFEELVCTRDIAVDPKTTLEELHAMIQSFGWLGYHLHNFRFVQGGKLVRAEPACQLDEDYFWDEPPIASDNITLSDAFGEFPSVLYSYDYGDGWEISILHAGIMFDSHFPKLPYCISGKGDWPPDDVGGEGGFMSFLECINNPNSEEFQDTADWGDSQGFEKYTIASARRALRNWKDYIN